MFWSHRSIRWHSTNKTSPGRGSHCRPQLCVALCTSPCPPCVTGSTTSDPETPVMGPVRAPCCAAALTTAAETAWGARLATACSGRSWASCCTRPWTRCWRTACCSRSYARTWRRGWRPRAALLPPDCPGHTERPPAASGANGHMATKTAAASQKRGQRICRLVLLLCASLLPAFAPLDSRRLCL